MRGLMLSVGVLTFAMSGAASGAPAAGPAPAKSAAPTKASKPDFGAMIGMMDKMFPPQPEPDPSRLALARTSVAAMWPDGSYARMMGGMMGSVFDGVMQMKPADLAPMGSKPRLKASAGPNLSIHDQAAAKDPYFDQRMAAIRAAVTDELGKVSVIIDPRVRDGLARAMARRFDAQQLGDINRFFATPSGHALAAQSMQLWVDPDMMRSLFGAMPEIFKLMPDMMQKVKEAEAKYPKPAKPQAAKPAQPPKS